ncbi:homeobox-containing protein 1 isoform X2 [Latimeria chalumnae]|uniref:homeobox-containing protein 1 isoform X2 n=1 Tax=Latimeria chalumnae TaxID=7897 RepID=UPI0003C13526|nr:PREDICTED: homeobox-containing protein 1-like isoform X2 [Latimeria chalumnae]|eukprot:XP_005995634.1 PREDICTED: homeobox-containing protein 1-like isoform X2 [Latimeria chalumnae]
MSYFVDEPRFTIEQIDLLQRLRQSGMTRQEILHALETLDRLDLQENEKFSRRPGFSCYHGNNVAASSSSIAPATTQTRSTAVSPSPSNCCDVSPCCVNHTENPGSERASVTNGALSPTYQNGVSQRSYGDDTGEEELDLEEKVEEYMRRDSNSVKEEIKVFLTNRRISQAIVGQVTGISQSYISQWLLQQGLEMSEPKKRAFYLWYLLEKTSPGATLNMRPMTATPKEEPDWRLNISSVGGNFRLKRGSRFTWRKECLSVMESYFVENQYPDEAKREEIANACNAVIQKPGAKLSEFERVTALKVYNWFANRRKELKRRANIAAMLENHGIEVQSPSGQSNSDDIEGPEFPDQDDIGSHGDLQQDSVPLATLSNCASALTNQRGETNAVSVNGQLQKD